MPSGQTEGRDRQLNHGSQSASEEKHETCLRRSCHAKMPFFRKTGAAVNCKGADRARLGSIVRNTLNNIQFPFISILHQSIRQAGIVHVLHHILTSQNPDKVARPIQLVELRSGSVSGRLVLQQSAESAPLYPAMALRNANQSGS